MPAVSIGLTVRGFAREANEAPLVVFPCRPPLTREIERLTVGACATAGARSCQAEGGFTNAISGVSIPSYEGLAGQGMTPMSAA